MKKILVISNYRGYHTARPEAEIFIGLAKLGFDITIMTYSDAEYISRFIEHGISVIPHHPIKKSDKDFIDIAHRELVKNGYDILHLFNNKAITNGLRAVKGLKTKVVIYRGASANMAWWNPLNYFKFYHPRIDYAICNSEEIRQKFLAVPFYKKTKAVTILKGHETTWYRDIKEHDIRAELGIGSESILYITVANNRRVKGIPILIKAMESIPHETNMNLIIIGEKMDIASIQKLTKESGNSNKINFLGFRRDALNIVTACDVFICPSTGSEALTKSVVEAMSLEVVPIISDIAGNQPLVDNNINGFVFKNGSYEDLADKMMTIYRNQHVITDFGKAAKWKIERDINSDKTVKQYAEFYLSR